MAFSYTPFVDGDVMVADTVRSTVQSAYEYVGGGIVAGDLGKASLGPEYFYRPDFFGFPLRGAVGCKQSLFGGTYRPDALDHPVKSDRFDIFPRPGPAAFGGPVGAALDVNESVPIPGLQRTVRAGATGNTYVIVRAHWSARIITDAADPAHAGYFAVKYRSRNSPTATFEVGAARRNAYTWSGPAGASIGGKRGQLHFNTIAFFSFNDDQWYDVWVEYVRGSAGAGVYQLLVGYRDIQASLHVAA